jgi:uncharacterized membrane protein
MARRLSVLRNSVLIFFAILMARITWAYAGLETDVAFLRIKQWVLPNPLWQGAFFVHVFSSLWLILAGLTQFSGDFLCRFRPWHRRLGRAYVLILLFAAGPSGLLMGFYANGGLLSQASFVLLALLWLYTTAQAWRRALRRDFKAHRRWMIRSYALTLSALSLRAWKWLLALTLALPPMDLYQIVAWLGWLPNLLLAEWLIRRPLKAGPAPQSA